MVREKVLDFASAYELAIIKIYFRKIIEHYITYNSRRKKSQIDYSMRKRDGIKIIKNCKVIPEDSVITHH